MQINEVLEILNKSKQKSEIKVQIKTLYYRVMNFDGVYDYSLGFNYIFNIKKNKDCFILYNNKNKLFLYKDKIKLDKNSEEWFFALANIIILTIKKEKNENKSNLEEIYFGDKCIFSFDKSLIKNIIASMYDVDFDII